MARTTESAQRSNLECVHCGDRHARHYTSGRKLCMLCGTCPGFEPKWQWGVAALNQPSLKMIVSDEGTARAVARGLDALLFKRWPPTGSASTDAAREWMSVATKPEPELTKEDIVAQVTTEWGMRMTDRNVWYDSEETARSRARGTRNPVIKRTVTTSPIEVESVPCKAWSRNGDVKATYCVLPGNNGHVRHTGPEDDYWWSGGEG